MATQSLRVLENQIKKLQAKADLLKTKNKGPALKKIAQLMRDNDISLSELDEVLNKKTTKAAVGKKVAGSAARKHHTVKVKYRHPETGQTWTGRGKTPR